MRDLRPQQGTTLIELLVSIVILSVAVTGIMMVITQLAGSSADPMLREQATAIAQSYMEEVLLQPLTDPQGGETNGAEAGEVRPVYDDVWDYAGLNDSTGALDQSGTAITGLEAYNIDITIAGSTLGPGAGSPAVRIEVRVTHDASNGTDIPLIAYRLN